MAQPYDYRLNLPDPSQSVLSGMQNVFSLANISAQQKLAAQQMEEAERAKKAKAQMEADLGALSENPSASALAGMMVKYPQLSEQLKRTYDVLSNEEKQGRVNQASQVYASLRAGQPEVAQQFLAEQIGAYRNSGMEKEAKSLEDLSKLIGLHPGTATTTTGLFLASAMGPDKFSETFTALEKERRTEEKSSAELTEAQAKAASAATAAKFAESNAVLDLQKKGWDITKIQEDIKIAKQNANIAAINAQMSREGNELKREELKLKLQEMQQKRDAAVRDKAAEIGTLTTQADNLLNTVDRALAMSVSSYGQDGKPSGYTDVVEDVTGPVSSVMPTIDTDSADLEEMINTLGNQITMSRIGEMKGALSNRDLDTLRTSLQAVSLRQSPKQLVDNLMEIQRLTQKARKNAMEKFGAPAELRVPDTPNAQPSAEEIDLILKKYGGQ